MDADFLMVVADIRELARLISTGEWRNDRRAAAGLLLHVNAELSSRGASILGHGASGLDDLGFDILAQNFDESADGADEFITACQELSVATGGTAQQIRRPFLNSLLMTMIGELLKRLPGLLDDFFDSP